MKHFSLFALGLCAALTGCSFGARDYQSETRLKSALAENAARTPWPSGNGLEVLDAQGSRTARAGLRSGNCVVWTDGDFALQRWDRLLGKITSPHYIALHEIAHCAEQNTEGYLRRKAEKPGLPSQISREVFADAAALGELWRQGALQEARLAPLAKLPAPGGADPHDTGFAARCLLREGRPADPQGALDTASRCADQALAAWKPPAASKAPRR